MFIAATLLLGLIGPNAGGVCSAVDSVHVQEWRVPWEKTRPRDPSVDRDGRVWFLGQAGHYIAVLDPRTGAFRKYDLEDDNHPHNQILDKEGYLWYSGNTSGHIGRLDTRTGKITKYPIPDASVRDPHTMIFDSKGDLWFTAQQSGAVGRFSPASGKFDIVKTAARSLPYGIVIDSKGRPWFDEFGTNKIGTLDPKTLALKEYPLPNAGARPRRIAVTSDDILWYGDFARGFVGRLDPKTGAVQEYALPNGPASQPYGMASDDRDRIWVAYIASNATGQVNVTAFDPKGCEFVATGVVPSGGLTVRYVYFHKPTRELWFGTDANTIGRIKVP